MTGRPDGRRGQLHRYPCPECGVEQATTAGWRARGRGMPCLACIRTRNGWTCLECGSADPHHPTPCPVTP